MDRKDVIEIDVDKLLEEVKRESGGGLRQETKIVNTEKKKEPEKPIRQTELPKSEKPGNRTKSLEPGKAENLPKPLAAEKNGIRTKPQEGEKAGNGRTPSGLEKPGQGTGKATETTPGGEAERKTATVSKHRGEKAAAAEPEEKKRRVKRRLVTAGIVLCLLTGMYLTVVYSNLPFIAKWRAIYIETAMTTNSHQWLATLFFPQSVIDKVMAEYKQNKKEQKKVASKWEEEDGEEETVDVEQEDFYRKYWELDTAEFRRYLENHPAFLRNGYDSLVIKDLEGKEDLKTSEGDILLALDTENNLLIVKVKGEGYQGKLAIVKNPDQVELAKAPGLGSYGQEAGGFGEANNALLVINASGFKDPKGEGSGGEVKGCLIIDGVDYGHPYAADWKFCGMKKDRRMYITNYSRDIVEDYRWAFEFYPALTVDSIRVVDGTYGMGIQPRACIGQTKNGDMLLLVVDGRQPGYSLGCTVDECEKILKRYHTYQSMNLDGGSSAIMWYDGEYITKSSSVTGLGRYMPDAFIVKRSQEEVVIQAVPE